MGVVATPIRSSAKLPMDTPPWAHFVAGANGGIVTAIVTSPLDVVRTRLQSDFYKPLVPTSNRFLAHGLATPFANIRDTLHIMNSIRYTEGWRGFFRGLGPSLAGVAPATAIKFLVYGNCKRIGARITGYGEDASSVHAAAAVAAGIATSTATNPIWLVKTRMQLDATRAGSSGEMTRQYRNGLDCVQKVLRDEGIIGLYRGLSASYLGTIETALHLVLYERCKVTFRKALRPPNAHIDPSGPWNDLTEWISTSGAAGVAKLAAGLLTYPHEVMRTRLRQAPTVSGRLKYTGLAQCFKAIWRDEGFAGLYGGLTPHMMRSIPSAIITLGVYESILRVLK